MWKWWNVREKSVAHATSETRMRKKERNQNEKKTNCEQYAIVISKTRRTHGRIRHDPRSTAEKEQNRYGLYKYIWCYAQTGIPFWSFIPASRPRIQSLACCKRWTFSYFLWIYRRKKNKSRQNARTSIVAGSCSKILNRVFVFFEKLCLPNDILLCQRNRDWLRRNDFFIF